MSNKPSQMKNYSTQLNPSLNAGNEARCTKPETPDLLKLNCNNFQYTQSVDTSILDPVVSREDYARFSLDRGRGILHSNSKIQLAVTSATNADAGKMFYPISTGIASYIDKAILRSGTTVIQEIQDFGHYYAQKGLLNTNEDVKDQYSVLDGRSNAYQLVTDLDNAAGVISSGLEQATQMFLDNGSELSEDIAFATPKTTVSNHNLKSRDNQLLSNKSEFILAISDLFPCLREFSLPLFMTDEVIIMELFFKTSQEQTYCVRNGDVVTDVYKIDPTKTKGVFDYINYSEEIMSEFKQANQTMALNFSDPVLVRSAVNYNTTPNYTTNIGGSGRIVDQVIVAHSFEDTHVIKSVTPLGNYLAMDMTTGAAATEKIGMNLRINDRLLFPLDVENTAEQYNNLVLTEARPINLTGEDYCKGEFGNPYSPAFTFEKYPLVSTMQGLRRYFGVNNARPEERINNNGISLIFNVTGPSNNNLICRAWVYVRRSLVFNQGRFQVVDS